RDVGAVRPFGSRPAQWSAQREHHDVLGDDGLPVYDEVVFGVHEEHVHVRLFFSFGVSSGKCSATPIYVGKQRAKMRKSKGEPLIFMRRVTSAQGRDACLFRKRIQVSESAVTWISGLPWCPSATSSSRSRMVTVILRFSDPVKVKWYNTETSFACSRWKMIGRPSTRP